LGFQKRHCVVCGKSGAPRTTLAPQEKFTHSLDIPKANVTFKKAATNLHHPLKHQAAHTTIHKAQATSSPHIKSTVRVSTGYNVIKLSIYIIV